MQMRKGIQYLNRGYFHCSPSSICVQKSNYSNKPHRNKNVAVVLSGSGVFDGSEIHEAVAVLLECARAGAKVTCFAPNIDQAHVVNHHAGAPSEGETRNVLVESGRIARGKIEDLASLSLNVAGFDALILPGGYGAAKNLSDFAFTAGEYNVIPQVEDVLKQFHAKKKPIGLCCIAPVLAAKVIPNAKVTIGRDAGTAECGIGSANVPKEVDEVCIDKENLLVTTPAYMCDAPIDRVFEGIQKMVNNVLQLAPEMDKWKTTAE